MEKNLILNNYKIIKQLGHGGFGQVFLAEENITGELRAIKKLRRSDTSQDDIIHEIKKVSKLKLSNIVMYYHHFWEEEQLYFVMEYCEGGTLGNKIKCNNYESEQILKWIKKLALTMHEIHERGIIHKDIKPDNILFSEDLSPKISDFGMANRYGGTRRYLSPQALVGMRSSNSDPREDIYSLGVVLMESWLGWNPFEWKTVEEIIEMHRDLSYPIEELPLWQQNIVLKAISRHPETRFQTMQEFAEALEAKDIPFVIKKGVFDAEIISEKIKSLIKRKAWLKAESLVEFAVDKYPNTLQILEVSGNYYLDRGKVAKAKDLFEKALKVNPRINIQKQLGEIHLEQGNYAKAISFLSDHIHRNPTDLHAQNLLLKCLFLTDRLEVGLALNSELLKVFPKDICLKSNLVLFEILIDFTQRKIVEITSDDNQSAFINYNRSVVLEPESNQSFSPKGKPTLKSKLLFMERRFLEIDHKSSRLTIVDSNLPHLINKSFSQPIIKIGRDGFFCNEILFPAQRIISRRHAVIINQQNEIWLYDLESFSGISVNDEIVNGKIQLIGMCKIQIDKFWIKVNPDLGKIL